MDTLIREKLMEIEHSEKCRILLAVESGSRAWGFPSPDSDYDVRFIYVRPIEHYLKLEQTRDVIELPINDLLDMNGWDLKKALCLLHRSNPTVFEWFSSPIIYKQTDFVKKFKPILTITSLPRVAFGITCTWLRATIESIYRVIWLRPKSISMCFVQYSRVAGF